MTTTLDTSGGFFVTAAPADGERMGYRWTDLSPFTRGYIEALFAGLMADQHRSGVVLGVRAFPDGRLRQPAFSDLAPETLARIIADCEAMQGHGLDGTGEVGASAWAARQDGLCIPEFPPLTVQLGDDGKVRFA